MRQFRGIHEAFPIRRTIWSTLLLILGASQAMTASANEGRGIKQFTKGLTARITGKKPAGSTKTPKPNSSLGKSRSSSKTDSAADKLLTIVKKGSSGRSARREGIKTIPLKGMTDENRQKAEEILDHISLFRELPTLQFDVDPGVYRYFISNPEVAVSIWRAMEISTFEMRQMESGEYVADTNDGTTGTIRVLYQDQDHQVITCQGTYSSPLINKPVRANAMIHLQTKFLKSADGKPQAQHQARMYITFSSQAVETAARLISPVSNLIIDRNFEEISLFLNLMTTAMIRQPGWVERLTGHLENVQNAQKKQLLDLTAGVYRSSRNRRSLTPVSGSEFNVQETLDPFRTTTSQNVPLRIIPRGNSVSSTQGDSSDRSFPRIIPVGGIQSRGN